MEEEISCKCGWKGKFGSILKEDEVCCPTVVSFKCPNCRGEMVSINTINCLLHVSIPLSSGAILSLRPINDTDNDKTIPRIEEEDNKKIMIGIRIAYIYSLIG